MAAPRKVAKRALKQRAKPVQSRSKESIRKIVDATHRLLRRAGPSGVTTPDIAKEAGVSVGSLYHFFPNKESIILALYEEKLAKIRESANRPIRVENGDWRAGFRAWLRRIKQDEVDIDFDLAMNEAMEHYPGLTEVSRMHAAELADTLAKHIKAMGSSWPDDALFDVAIHVFFLNQSLWLYWSFAGRSLPQGVDRLADSAIALIAPAIEGAPAPSAPYASRRRKRS